MEIDPGHRLRYPYLYTMIVHVNDKGTDSGHLCGHHGGQPGNCKSDKTHIQTCTRN